MTAIICSKLIPFFANTTFAVTLVTNFCAFETSAITTSFHFRQTLVIFGVAKQVLRITVGSIRCACGSWLVKEQIVSVGVVEPFTIFNSKWFHYGISFVVIVAGLGITRILLFPLIVRLLFHSKFIPNVVYETVVHEESRVVR